MGTGYTPGARPASPTKTYGAYDLSGASDAPLEAVQTSFVAPVARQGGGYKMGQGYDPTPETETPTIPNPELTPNPEPPSTLNTQPTPLKLKTLNP